MGRLLALLFTAWAAFACGAPAQALTAGQRIAILTNPCSGIPIALNFSANGGSGQYCFNRVKLSGPSAIPNWSFTRSGGGVAFTSSGAMVSFGSNVPRITDQGYLAEGSATNLAIQSVDLTNTAWTKVNLSSVATDGTLAPDGTLAQKLTAAAGVGIHSLRSAAAIGVAAASNYAVTEFVHAGTSRYVWLLLSNQTPNYCSAIFDVGTLATASATQSSVGSTSGTILAGSAVAQYLGGGWFRLQMVCQSAATSMDIQLGIAAAATGNTFDSAGQISFTATGAEAVYAFAPQVELTMATSWISTTTTTGTRNADVAKITGLGGVLTGTFSPIVRASLPIGDSITRVLAEVTDGSASNRYDLRRSSTNTAQFIASTSGVNTTFDAASGETGQINLNMAARIAPANYQPAVGGALAALQTYAEPPGLNELDIGMTAAGVGQCNCYISSIRVLGAAPNAILQSSTQ